ncbi:hypothetical protein TSTA_084860 [Talaromyces stipitatus ATCC 10500]|uniref:Uncharacterized protein n=1 Tax=Talaromyces stipitatus (strain ATCC 10500 / CBS 375.48 / QM 6759 / NRRL 1006) TaxID=441959 RepID=B8M0F8_TALSN|nr:uncharacterized protein TSTA_084860 [Talaromyces stipitatus ATCC 10500]EED21255.1 hypothetical protein TSTA_084860 [Talaromyces stipitatus ATCC 10500]
MADMKNEERGRLLPDDLLNANRVLYVHTPQMPWWRNALNVFLVSAISVVMTVPVMLLITPTLVLKEKKPFTYTDCGNTSTSARQAGCGYEPMMRAWVPPECYYTDIIDDYDVFRDRKWFADKGLSITSNIERLESGDEELAYTPIAVEKRYPAISWNMANIDHSHHCAHMVALRIQNSYNETFVHEDDTFTESYLNFQTCVLMNWA